MAVQNYSPVRDLGAYALAAPAVGANGDSDTIDRGTLRRAGLLAITSAIGATPTVTVNLMGSVDGANFWNISYATVAAPETATVAALTITTAVTSFYILRPDHPWRQFLVRLSANTNVTITLSVAL